MVKVALKDSPGESVLELSITPESDVTVWGTESSLTQVTFAPALIVNALGLNEKFFILTVMFSGAALEEMSGTGIVGVVGMVGD